MWNEAEGDGIKRIARVYDENERERKKQETQKMQWFKLLQSVDQNRRENRLGAEKVIN